MVKEKIIWQKYKTSILRAQKNSVLQEKLYQKLKYIKNARNRIGTMTGRVKYSDKKKEIKDFEENIGFNPTGRVNTNISPTLLSYFHQSNKKAISTWRISQGIWFVVVAVVFISTEEWKSMLRILIHSVNDISKPPHRWK